MKEVFGNPPLAVVLAGIGGYGEMYLAALLAGQERGLLRLAGTIDPNPDRCRLLERIRALRIPVFPGFAEFYGSDRADLTVVSSPIQWHCRQACSALESGSHVLCEKPLSATVQEALQIIRAKEKAARKVAVGYQWSYSAAVAALKKDILAGVFGRARRLTTLHLWPRDEKYYKRNGWAGRRKDDQGSWVLDSPAHNAFAHELHNMFFLLGGAAGQSAVPADVSAELYRANAIENFDTCACRSFTEGGVEILFLASHATREKVGPWFHFEFDKAVVRLDESHPQITARFRDGTVRGYGHPDDDPQEKKLWESIAAIRTGREAACGPEAAISQVLCVNGMQESAPDAVPFSEKMIRERREPGNRWIWVEGLEQELIACYGRHSLPAELGIAWASAGRRIDLRGYAFYPQAGSP